VDELSKMAGGREVKLGTCEPGIEFDELADILCSPYLNTDDVSVVRLGRQVSLTEFTVVHLLGDGSQRPIVSASALLSLLELGDTILLNNAELYCSRVRQVARELENSSGFRVNCNVFFTAAGFDGLPAHSDKMDALIVQVSGSKRWTIYESDTNSVQPRVFLGDVPAGMKLETDLNRGDCLYLPAGLPHRTNALAGKSCHATFSFCAPSLKKFLDPGGQG